MNGAWFMDGTSCKVQTGSSSVSLFLGDIDPLRGSVS